MYPRAFRGTPIANATRGAATLAAAVALVGMGSAVGNASSPDADQDGNQPSDCDRQSLSIDATMHRPAENIMGVAVTNAYGPACNISGTPTVTFGDLDGAAYPVPAGEVNDQILEPGETIHAAVRTAPAMDSDEATLVQYVNVAGHAAHYPTTFTADEIGSEDSGIWVYDSATTRWHDTYAGAETTLLDALP